MIVTVKQNPEETLRILESIRSELRGRTLRLPEIVALVPVELAQPVAAQYRLAAIPTILRRVPDQLYSEVRLLGWMRNAAGDKTTFRIGFLNGHYTVILCGTVHAEEVPLTDQLRQLFILLANSQSSALTVEQLADALGVCRQTIKKYMAELRARYDAVNARVRASQTGAEVFLTTRAAGGTLHQLDARIIWDF
jgi:hypothetical protein